MNCAIAYLWNINWITWIMSIKTSYTHLYLSIKEWNDKMNKIVTSFLYNHYLYTLYYSLQPTNQSLCINKNRKLLQNKIILHRPIQAIHAYIVILTHQVWYTGIQ
jgi:hypothetical protein